MNKNANRIPWVLFLVLIAGVATTSLAHAGQPKGKDKEAEAEAKQFTQEEEAEIADRAKGIKHKDRRTFSGRFDAVPEAESKEFATNVVVGTFTTNSADTKPGRTYLVKMDVEASKATLKALMRFDGKTAQILGKLRVIDANGEGKYLMVNTVLEASSPTPPVKDRRKSGGV